MNKLLKILILLMKECFSCQNQVLFLMGIISLKKNTNFARYFRNDGYKKLQRKTS